MKRRFFLGAVLAVGGVWMPALALAQEAAPAAPVAALNDAEKEAFLLEAQVVKRKTLKEGITASQRATLRRGDLQHDAHIQIIDEYKTQTSLSSGMDIDFRDTWKNNVAAYRLDRLLALGMVPVTVARRDESTNKMASFTWWVDGVLMTEKDRFVKKIKAPDPEDWNRQIFVVRIFDQLIYNMDRNLGNLLIDKDWTVWMIDHTRGFKIFKELKAEKELGRSCARDLLPALRRLDKPTLLREMKDVLTESQVNALLGRRDRIVKYYEDKIAAQGEAAVLYDLPERLTARVAKR
jgi:hypothetical protein